MIIRCPKCEHTRSISEGKIPPSAELATCPKCKQRFRFRTLPRAPEAEEAPADSASDARTRAPKTRPAETPAGPEVIRPQEAFRESAEQNDIWDAVDALHRRWEKQLDQHVVDVEHPGRLEAAAPAESQPQTPEGPLPQAAAQPQAPEALPPQSSAVPSSGGPVAGVGPESDAARPAAPPQDAPPQIPPQAPRIRVPSPPSGDDEFFSPLQDKTVAGVADPAAVAKSAAGQGRGAENGAARPRFPYGPHNEEGPDPEARVEKDMEMLRDSSRARPMRDLGRLREYPENAGAESAGQEEGWEDLLLLPEQSEEGPGIPWENPGMGRMGAFAATVRGVMFGGPAFFARFRGVGALTPGYLFFLIMGYFCILCSLAWCKAAETLLPGLLPPPPQGAALPGLLLLAPAALGLMQLFVTGWIRTLLRLLDPEKADFGLIYKVVSYSVAPFALSVVPFAGPALGAAWFMASLASGCRGALRLSLPLSLLLPLPPAAMLLFALVWYFL